MFDYEDFQHLAQRAFREPGNAGLFSALLLHTEWLGNYTESLELYTALANRHPYCGYAWYNLGWVLTGLGRIEDALDAFEFAYLAQPTLKEAYEAYVAWALFCGKPRRAWLCYDTMMRYIEMSAQDLCRLSLSQRLAGDLKAAKDTCRQALQLDPYCAEAEYQLAACYAEECRYNQAIRWAREATQHNDKHANAHQLLAHLYNQMGHPALAGRHAWRAIEQEPDMANAWVNLMESAIAQQDYANAAQIAETALLYTETAELLYCAAACHFWADQRAHGLHLLAKALSCAPEKSDMLFQWAPALLHDEEVLQALRF